jgi:hypothetical protein
LQRPHQLSLDPFCSDRSCSSGFSQVHFSRVLIRKDFAARAGRGGKDHIVLGWLKAHTL